MWVSMDVQSNVMVRSLWNQPAPVPSLLLSLILYTFISLSVRWERKHFYPKRSSQDGIISLIHFTHSKEWLAQSQRLISVSLCYMWWSPGTPSLGSVNFGLIRGCPPHIDSHLLLPCILPQTNTGWSTQAKSTLSSHRQPWERSLKHDLEELDPLPSSYVLTPGWPRVGAFSFRNISDPICAMGISS